MSLSLVSRAAGAWAPRFACQKTRHRKTRRTQGSAVRGSTVRPPLPGLARPCHLPRPECRGEPTLLAISPVQEKGQTLAVPIKLRSPDCVSKHLDLSWGRPFSLCFLTLYRRKEERVEGRLRGALPPSGHRLHGQWPLLGTGPSCSGGSGDFGNFRKFGVARLYHVADPILEGACPVPR